MTTADEVLELRKKYKRAKQQYNLLHAQIAALPAADVHVKVKKKRAPSGKPRSAAQQAHAALFSQQQKAIKELRAADPTLTQQAATKLYWSNIKAAK